MAEFAIPDAALGPLLQWMFSSDSSSVEALSLRLNINDYTPSRSSTTADFVQATFGGYSAKSLPRSSYGAPVLELHIARMTLSSDPFVWTPSTTGQVLFGSYIVGAISNNLYAARRFATPRTTVAGEPLRLFPVWTLQTSVIS